MTRHHDHALDVTVQHAVNAVARKVGINNRGTPPVLDHTFASRLSERRMDERTVQKLLRHAKLETSEVDEPFGHRLAEPIG